MYRRDGMQDREMVERHVERAPWSPAQIVALVLGAAFTILGAMTLAKTGVHGGDQFLHQHVQVAGFHHTPLLGAIELAWGLLMVLAGAVPGAYRSMMTFLGVLALGFGIVTLIQPTSFHSYLGVHTGNGWLFLFSGVISLAAAMLSPVIYGRDRGVATRRYEAEDRAVDVRGGVVEEPVVRSRRVVRH
jgi:hypothetical protein